MDELKKLLENAGIAEAGYEDTSLVQGDGRVEYPNAGWSRDQQRRWDGAEQILASIGDKLFDDEKAMLQTAVSQKGKMRGASEDYEVDRLVKTLIRFV